MRKVEVTAHDPRWQAAFKAEAESVLKALGDENVVAVHHIGSTAIPNIYAKPVIDLLVEVRSHEKLDERSGEMAAIGYEVMGEYGIAGRRYFRKSNELGVRTHHVHAFESGSPEIKRHLAFRDYMIAHPHDAQRYSELKRQLARAYPEDIDSYMDGKDSFIKEIDCRAAKWRETARQEDP